MGGKVVFGMTASTLPISGEVMHRRTTLSGLFEQAGLPQPAHRGDVAITGLCSDSRQVFPGCVFFAVAGSRDNGARFIEEAVRKGAVAVVCEEAATLPAVLAPVAVFRADNVRRTKAILAHAYADWPSRHLTCVGVTGTNGKTTTASMLSAVLEADGQRPTFIGTVGCRFSGEAIQPAQNTTPDALELASILARTRNRGSRAAVLEVSSHGLDQERTAGIGFDAAVFTQLAREHLDYHGSLEAYWRAKSRLFQSLSRNSVAVLNAEDPYSLDFLKDTAARVVTYGLTPGADVTARVERMEVDGTAFELSFQGRSFAITTRLIGRYNLMNALAAAATGLALGVDGGAIQAGLGGLRRVPGRLEPVDCGQDFRVLIDYAHTDDALEKVLRLLKPLTRGQLITVFGCGGSRDQSKRSRMGRVAAMLSDQVWLTSDNPRGEDPAEIAQQVLAGAGRRHSVRVELDRRAAIESALGEAKGGDIVLIAGKGHETVQIIGEQRLPFDDRQVAEEALWQRCN